MTLPRDKAVEILRQMVRVRRFEERSAELYMEAKIRGFLHLYIGQEAVAAGAIPELEPTDNLIATYREHGHALIRGVSANAVMAEMFGKKEGCSRGRGGSMHLYDARTRFYGGNAIVGGGLPVAVGLALADKFLRRPNVTACFFGEGAVAEGVFHESLNLASLWELPVLFCCENNLYAMGTAIWRSEAETDLSAKVKGYRIPCESVDGMDPEAVSEAASRAVSRVRETGLPFFLEFRTYRFRAHSMFDPELYRDKKEVAYFKEKDPIPAWIATLKARGDVTEAQVKAMEAEAERETEEAVAFAEAGTRETYEEMAADVTTRR